MKVLGIDTSSDICSVCLLEDTRLLKEISLNNGKTHSENLVPLLKELMEFCNVTFKDIDLIAVDKGPGSFTGIRIGISTVKAIAEVHNIKVVGITSLKSLAFNSLAIGSSSSNNFNKYSKTISNIQLNNESFNNSINVVNNCISLIDARNNQVYCGVFLANTADIYFASDINDVLECINTYVNENTIFIGNGSILHKKIIQDFFKMPLKFSENNEQSSVSTALAGLDIFNTGEFDTADTILPFYLRKSQAERMKELNNNGNNK